MKAVKKWFWTGGLFLLTLCVLAVALDLALTWAQPLERSDLFSHNDYEKTILTHGGESTFDRVLYGNSVIISAYLEDQSQSAYVNFGLDYGVVTDLRDMLKGGDLTVTKDLVLALNYFTLLDTMDTNPTYPWHRALGEPYLYFQRDRLQSLLTSYTDSLKAGEAFVPVRYDNYEKYMYSGRMNQEQLNEKIATHRALFWGLGTEYYEENLQALTEVIDFCAAGGIRLRVLWTPWNNYIPMPDNPRQVRALADQILTDRGIEVLDMENVLPQDCFHDLGHLNQEHGAVVFTEEIDPWLLS